MESSRVRVSIANLAWYLTIRETGMRHSVGILNPRKLTQGTRQYMALGGGAMLTKVGKLALELDFGASDFEPDTHTGLFDARFQIDENRLEEVLSLFEDAHGLVRKYEEDQSLDILEELTGNEFGEYGSVLTHDEARLVELKFVRVVRQQPSDSGADTSGRARASVPTRRLFRIFELIVPRVLFDAKLALSPVIRILTHPELKTTEGGSKAGVTSDGFLIQNNLFQVGEI